MYMVKDLKFETFYNQLFVNKKHIGDDLKFENYVVDLRII